MSLILSLDTTSKHVSIALSEGAEIYMEYNFLSRDDLTASLIPALEFLLKNASLTLGDIDVVGVTVGPGLFTGIRVGLSTIKGLFFAANKHLVPVTSLEALAFKYRYLSTPVVSMIDARRDEVYIAPYQLVENRITPLKPPALLHVSAIPDYLAGIEECSFSGSGATIHREFLEEKYPHQVIAERSFFLAPEVCQIASYRHAENNYLTHLQELLPLYIRKPDAEQHIQTATQK